MNHNGEQLKQAMKAKGVSCDYLSRKLGKTTTTIVNYRKNEYIKTETKELIAEALQMEVNDIFKI